MSIFDEIAQIVGPQNISTDRIECLCNSRDMSVHQGVAQAVVYAKTTEQVSAIMKLAAIWRSMKASLMPRCSFMPALASTPSRRDMSRMQAD